MQVNYIVVTTPLELFNLIADSQMKVVYLISHPN